MTAPLVDLARVEEARRRHEHADTVSRTSWSQRMHDAHADRAALLAAVARLVEAVEAAQQTAEFWRDYDKAEKKAAQEDNARLRAAVEDAHGADCEIVTGRKDGARVRPECSCGYFDRRRAALAPRPTPPGEER